MSLLIAIAVVILFTIVPVMLAAKALNATNSSFLPCLIAVVLSAVVGGFVTQFIQNVMISIVVSFLVAVFIYSVVLGAKYIQAACIALLASAIQYGSIFLLGMLGLSITAATIV